MGLEQCRLIELPKITDVRGNLTFIEGMKHVPFEIKRVFYIYDVPTGESRGYHAHKLDHQFIICLSGSLNVYLDDGKDKKTVHLNRPWLGLHIPPMIWALQGDFDPGTVCMVLTSTLFSEADYYRDYDLFLEAVQKSR